MESLPTVESLLAHSGWVTGLVHSLVADPHRADDVVQETWVAAMERPPGKLNDARAWLAGVVRNLVREERRSDQRRDARERTSARPERTPSAADVVTRADLHHKLARTVLELREPYRSTLLLRYFEGLTPEEIARELSLPGSTVRNRILRGLDLLRDRLDAECGGRRRAWLAPLASMAAPSGASAGAGAALVPAITTARGGTLMLKLTAILLGATAVGGALIHPGSGDDENARVARAAGLDAPAQHSSVQEPQPATKPDEVQQDERKSVAPKDDSLLRGRVVDGSERPIPGASIFVCAYSNPFEEEANVAFGLERQRLLEVEGDGVYKLPPDKLEAEKVVIGRRVALDEEGRFELSFGEKRRVYVQVAGKLGLKPRPQSGQWVETPVEELVLTADVIPLAEATFQVTDETTGNPVRDFELAIEGREASVVTRTGRARVIWEMPTGEPQTIHVAVVEPKWAKARKDLVLLPDGVDRVELVVSSEGERVGVVQDAAGQPVEGALVFWGGRERMRGRSPWVDDPERIIGGVHTDATGAFTLPGTGRELTAFHERFSSTTVAAASASLIQLGAPGTVHGEVLDRDRQPRPGVEIALEGIGETATNERGRFTFENVPSGVHTLHWPERFWLGFAIDPGETLDLVGGVRVDRVRVQLQTGGAPFEEEFGGLILGQDQVFGIHEFGADKGEFQTGRMRRGNYVLMSSRGYVGHFTVDGPEAIADMGDADLTVVTRPTDQVFLIPNDGAPSDPALLTFGRRMGRDVPPSGRLEYRPLPRGKYWVGRHGEEALHEVVVSGPGAELILD